MKIKALVEKGDELEVEEAYTLEEPEVLEQPFYYERKHKAPVADRIIYAAVSQEEITVIIHSQVSFTEHGYVVEHYKRDEVNGYWIDNRIDFFGRGKHKRYHTTEQKFNLIRKRAKRWLTTQQELLEISKPAKKKVKPPPCD